MTLRNGKFYDDAGNVVPPEFGNSEQIRILYAVENLRKEGEFPDVEYDISPDGDRITGRFYPIECPCGNTVRFPFMGHLKTPAGKRITCECGMRYEGFDGDWGFGIKLIS